MNDITILSVPPVHSFPLEWYEIAEKKLFWYQWRFSVFLQQLQALGIGLDGGIKGLEVGCGSGIVRQQVEEKTNWVIDGADICQEALRLNHGSRGQTFLYDVHDRHRDLQEVYDLVLLFDVLEHIEETGPFIDAVLYHVKPGGWIFMNVPALKMLFSEFDMVQQHFRRYTKKMMWETLSSKRLAIRDVRYWGLSLIPLLLIRKLLVFRKTSPRAVIKRGFEVPSERINTWLVKMMHLETAILKKPILGTCAALR
jgi:SAM-dependent methyltransferase